MDRRVFVKNTGILAAVVGLTGSSAFTANASAKNKLPEWRGFNLTDFNTPFPRADRRYTTEEHLKWMSDWGFDFVRFPVSYPYYLDFDRTKKSLLKKFIKLMKQQLIKSSNLFNWRISTISM
jgi:aryl-phospho-beta-D-glucosidase BglC (GH1 family)